MEDFVNRTVTVCSGVWCYTICYVIGSLQMLINIYIHTYIYIYIYTVVYAVCVYVLLCRVNNIAAILETSGAMV